MKRFRLCLTPIILAFFAGCGVDKEKIIGTWELEDGPEKIPKGTLWEFTSDGNRKEGSAGFMGEKGTYEINGSVITLRLPGKSEGKARIKELTDDRLVLKDDAE